MTTEILKSPGYKKTTKAVSLQQKEQLPDTSIAEDKLQYIFRNGENVIGAGGLEIFEDCTLLCKMGAIKEEQKLQFTSPGSSSSAITIKKTRSAFLSNAELWNIHHQRKERLKRRYI